MHIIDERNNLLTIRSESALHVLIEILQDEKTKRYNISKIGAAVRKKLGTNWNISNGEKYGKIHEFVQRHSPEVFQIDGNMVSLVMNRIIDIKDNTAFISMLDKKNEIKPETEESKTELNSIDKLANVLIQRCFGCFFEFNDSHVKAMTIPETKKAFEGKDSAYLLVYRKSFGIDGSTELKTIDTTPLSLPPSFWMRKAEETNRLLHEQRYV